MRRRLDLAASLILGPAVLFMDEPTTGLDPRGRNEVWAAIRDLVAGGTSVLLTTQYLDEADQLADQICVIDSGRVIADGSPAQLKAAIGAITSTWWCGTRPRCRRRGGAGARRRRRAASDRDARRVSVAVPEPDGRADHGGARPARCRHRGGGHRAAPADTRRGLPATDLHNESSPAEERRYQHEQAGGQLADGWTITVRDLVHWARQPWVLVIGLLFPVLMVLMFGYLLGGSMIDPGRGRLPRVPDARHVRADDGLRHRVDVHRHQ